jgi:hypothetical protein
MFVSQESIDALRVRRDDLRSELLETRSEVLAVPVELSRLQIMAQAAGPHEDRALRHPGAAFGYGRHAPLQTEEVMKGFITDATRRMSTVLSHHGDDMSERRRFGMSAAVQVGDKILAEMSGDGGRSRVRTGRTLGSFTNSK